MSGAHIAASELREALTGVMTALVTPFSDDYSLMEENLAQHVDFQVAEGVRVLVPAGTVGEFPSLSLHERMAVCASVAAAAHGRCAVVASVTATCLAEIREYAEHAQHAGAAGVLIMFPPFYELTDEEQWDFLTWVDSEIALPFVLYATPDSRVKFPSIRVLEQAAKLEGFAGIKDASGDVQRLAMLRGHLDEAIAIINASERMLADAAAAGIRTCMTATSCFAPGKVRDATSLGEDSKREPAAKALRAIAAFRELFDFGSSVRQRPRFIPWTKAACNLMGLPAGPPRRPMRPLDEGEMESLETVLNVHFGRGAS